MKRLLILVVILFFNTALSSQNPSEDFLGSWYTYGSNHRLNEKFSLNPYGQIRFYEPSSNYNLAFISLRGNYHIKHNQSFGMGYAYLDIDTVFEFDNEPNVHENRIFEQYILTKTIGKLRLQHRARLEHRFLKFRDKNNSELQNRFRYQLQLKYDFNKTFFLVLSNEPFVNFQDQVFHENRFYCGIGINILRKAQLQLGYLKQNIRKNNLNRIQVGISFQTDSRRPNTKLSKL